ncbi:MAG: FtsX-like permease family protein, partial [Eggerthellaceae bacterium]|nr:FtsX-like permease family protein [Eggerthellaceae bacterium]
DDPQRVEEIAVLIEVNDMFRTICDDPNDPAESLKYGQKTVDRLFALTKYVRYIGIALIALMIFIALVFINNTIRLAIMARRKEIAIMRLVGASNSFIRGPFLMEGFLHVMIGTLLAIGAIELLRKFALPMVVTALPWLPVNLSSQTFLTIYAFLFASGLVIGLVGSSLAMRRYLKV